MTEEQSPKYIGETEKNLSALFDSAHGQTLVLLFDEADSCRALLQWAGLDTPVTVDVLANDTDADGDGRLGAEETATDGASAGIADRDQVARLHAVVHRLDGVAIDPRVAPGYRTDRIRLQSQALQLHDCPFTESLNTFSMSPSGGSATARIPQRETQERENP